MLTWKDVTPGWDRSPSSFESRAGRFRIKVHRHIEHPGAWCYSCPEMDIGATPLEGVDDPESAKARAGEVVRRALEEALEAFGEVEIAPSVSPSVVSFVVTRLKASASGYVLSRRFTTRHRRALDLLVQRGEVESFKSDLGNAFRLTEHGRVVHK